VAFSDI